MIQRVVLVLALWLASVAVFAQPATITIDRAEAVRSDWNADAAPADGWVPVTLMDQWQTRWPGHDGVVWYRLRWQQADAHVPTGLLVDYTCLSAAVYLNGSLIARDASLVEPLSRSWHTPRYFLLDAPLLRQGENTLLVRVSGLAAYQPGFGTVSVGEPAQVEAMFRQGKRIRHDLQLFDTAIGAVLAALFGLFWLLRRQDTTYGWYALNGLFGLIYGYNFIATSPWPFSTTDGWQAFTGAAYVAVAATYAIFLLRYADRRWPRLERALLAIASLVFVLALAMPQTMGPHRNVYIVPMMAFHYFVSVAFVVFAARSGRRDQQVLALCIALPLLTALYDAAVYLGVVRGTGFIGSFTSPVMVLGMGFVLAHRFVGAMKRVEGFNTELQREVAAATDELSTTLSRQHALELSHSRAGERLKLVRDLHDGFGGTLVGAIARLEQAPESTSRADVVALLKEMREDLRLVIDSTAQEQADLAALIASLRHRAGRLLEAADIDAHWQLQDIDGVELGSARSLDLLRLLQEALTNVFKHSRAQRVNVRVARIGERMQLQVRDDGRGLTGAGDSTRSIEGGGAGFASMHLRAQRLGGVLQVASTADGTDLRLDFPLAA
ncbi:sensor histidine kinase [Luteimonas cucumeris]|uniref:sensor histidine kinase n=1 Tax=Luteimonas cucumeris TaxID=985012 RepID=UPI0011A79943|nr:ATP-binding protein [Luteimonas cucumeris]